jgi:prolyl-tRNA editing enzyme YbaK/EbsC (Cys-tRNA(Pro) deacylase)
VTEAVDDQDDPIEAAVVAALDESGVPYELMPCDPDFADTAAFCERYGVSPEMSANTIVVASKAEPKQFCACVVTATTKLDVNGTVRRLLGAKKASFASAEETKELTGMLIGGVTAVALPPGLPLYVDAAVMEQPEVIIGGGSRSLKVRVSPRLFSVLPNTTVVEGLAVPR